MRILFIRSDKPRERLLAEAFVAGARKHGEDAAEIERPDGGEFSGDLPTCELACFVGVKSVRMFRQFWGVGTHTAMFDKGYVREANGDKVKGWKYWRVSLDGHHPTRYLAQMKMPPDRWKALGLKMKPWKTGKTVIFAGSSEKYHEFYELDHPTKFAEKYVKRLNGLTDKRVIYRPKPSWDDAIPVPESEFSFGKGTNIVDLLGNAHCLVTHGSNAVFEAALNGVPCIVMGDAVAKPISSTDLEDVNRPRLASDAERLQWASNLAYCQWTLGELESGEAWPHIKGQLLSYCA